MMLKSLQKLFFALLLGALLFGAFAPVKAQAMDPVTIAILAPVAVKAAEVMMPYVMRGLQCGGLHMLKMGKDLLELFKIPLGILQATLGAPIGFFENGITNLMEGFVAPLKLCYHAVTLPLAFVGVSAD